MSIGWKQDKLWSDCYMPQIRQIVGPVLLEPASDELDQKEATDLVILKARDLRIACRVRRPGYADAYPFDFTIRANRPSGQATELEKIMSGFADLCFYGHANEQGLIHRHLLLDLDVFREAMTLDPYPHQFIRVKYQRNFDQSSGFHAYDVRSFPSWIIKSSSHPITFDYPKVAA